MKGAGLLYVVFGKEYDKMAAHSIALSRRFTNLPICILTNLKERNEKWGEITNIEFKYISAPLEENRDIKTRMIQYSPFNVSMYIDCDSVIRQSGIEDTFSILGNRDLLVQKFKTFRREYPVLQIYKEMMKQTGIRLPMTRYLGGFMIFRKNERTHNFFDLWNEYYKMGTGADMPAFCCAIKNSKSILLRVVFETHRIFGVHKKGSVIIQHNFKGQLNKELGIPKWKPWRKFDTNRKHSMTWVDF